MPGLKNLSGPDLIEIFGKLGFSVIAQKGSHIKIGRNTGSGDKQTLTIPNHSELDKGTIKAIFRQASRYLSENELRPYFFN